MLSVQREFQGRDSNSCGSRALPSISAADAGEGGVGSRGAGEDMLVELA